MATMSARTGQPSEGDWKEEVDQKMDTTTLPVKRLFDSNNSLEFSVKKSKVSLYDDRDKDEDDIPSLNMNKRPGKSADNSFSSLRKELALLKTSFEECTGNQQIEERRLQSIKRNIEKCCKELENKETQVKELESEKNVLDCRVNEFESKKGEFEGLVKNFESEKTHFVSRQKEFESKEKEFERRVKEFQSKEEEFEGKMQQFENQAEDNLKALQLKENQIEVQIKDPESKLNNFGGQLKELELTEKQYDEEKEFDTSNMDDQFSITIDGTSEEFGILDNLQKSSDPAKLVLDIILNPTIPLPKKGDKAVIIDESRIYLMQKLMTISPDIKLCVRDEALKLAHELKANMKENTENSLEVLGFLMILSIYGLLTYFDEDEVFKLFASVASVAEYKIAVKLFRTLGFVNKVSESCDWRDQVRTSDWRGQLPPESRPRIVSKIVEILKRCLPRCGEEELHQLWKIAQRFEERMFTAATSQYDYNRRIAVKLLQTTTRHQVHDPVANNLPTNQVGPSL